MGKLMEIRRRLILDSVPSYLRLPPEYEKISYVTADGNQSLRTEYLPAIGDEFHMKVKAPVANTLFSAGVGTYQLVLIGGFSSSGWYCKFFSSATYTIQCNYSANNWYDVDINQYGTLTTNGHTYSCPTESELDGTATNLWLAERRNWSQRYVGDIAEFWIKNNGNYKMYLIPCKRKSDQKVGMYDTISKTFFTSARNDFIAGT